MTTKRRLGDIVKLSSGGTPSKKNSDYWGGDIPWVSAKNMKDEFLSNSSVYITQEGLNHGSKLAHQGSLLLLVRGSGLFNDIPICYVERDLAFNQDVKCIESIDPMNVPNKYIFYWLKSRKYALSQSVGVTTIGAGKFDTDYILNLEIPIPRIEVIEKQVSLLDVITQKIRCNTKVNDNLEEQALALFHHYFMDFSPYGGVAPSDWTEVSLDDVCTRITDGSHYSPADSPESPYPMYSVKDMETYGFNSASCKHISEEDFRKMQKGDCVPLLNDILVAKDGSYLKEIFICSEERDAAILSSIAIFRPDTNIIIPEILLYLLKQPSVRKDVGDNYVSGSALPRIVLKDFKKYRFMLPPMDEQLKIGSVLQAIRMQTKANIDEIQCLSSTRDALLPKLMSGEIDVSNIEF